MSTPQIRVLHLEDDLLDAELIHERLHARERGRWNFVHVTGREGFESALDRQDYDLVIMDHNIPGYDGMMALQEAHRRLPETPIIIISGSLTEEDAVECLKAGATDYVLKARMQRLIAAADRALLESEEKRQRLRAERELEQLEHHFAELASHSRDVYWFIAVDPEKTLYVSPAIERIWGRPASDFYFDPRGWASAIHAGDQARVNEVFDRWVKGEGERFDEEFRIVRPDGTVRWIHDTGTRIRDATGRVVRVSGIARDITRRREAEGEVRAQNADLERRVEDRTTELRSANRDLDAFSFLVSHDLRAPLRAVSGFTALLSEECGAQLDDTGKHFVERIMAGCTRMELLIEDILALAQIARSEMMASEIPLSAMVDETFAALRKKYPARSVEFAVERGLRIHADRRLMRVAIENLLDNAWKFTGKREHAHIEIGLATDVGLLATYYVRDNGAGFDARFSERLFTPFQRLHGEDEFTGSGIGLAKVRRVIERHGGNVWAEGRPGEGATFYFSLPKAPRKP